MGDDRSGRNASIYISSFKGVVLTTPPWVDYKILDFTRSLKMDIVFKVAQLVVCIALIYEMWRNHKLTKRIKELENAKK